MKSSIKEYIAGLGLPGLGAYGGSPAIFNQQAPDDQDYGWDGPQYGRIVYDLLLRDDPERKVSGNLKIMAAYANTGDGKGHGELAEAAKALQAAFDGAFFFGGGMAIATAWRRTGPFSEKMGGGMDVDVFGEALDFDVHAFPYMDGCDAMDPAASLARHIGQAWPGVKVLNFGRAPGAWKPGMEDIAAYVRTESVGSGTFPATYACTWHSAALKVHAISGADGNADRFCMGLIARLSESGRFPMGDGSPCFVQRCQYYKGMDALKDGQVAVQGQYGTLRETEMAAPLQSIDILGRG